MSSKSEEETDCANANHRQEPDAANLPVALYVVSDVKNYCYRYKYVINMSGIYISCIEIDDM